MRRSEKEITDPGRIEEIIRGCTVCHLGLCRDGEPYVVPMCFGYLRGTFYFHCAREGMKLNFIRANPRVCIQMERGVELIVKDKPCSHSMAFESVIAKGTAREVSDPQEKALAMNALMDQYHLPAKPMPAQALAKVKILAVETKSITGKGSPR